MSGMSAFIPTQVGYLMRSGDSFTVTGSPQYGQKERFGVSMIRVEDNSQPTSVRADTSGSKSFADENIEVARMLMVPQAKPKINDLFEFMGDTYEVQTVKPVYSMYGGLDHYQVDMTSWV
jgi:hypothetical protein